MIRIGGGEGNGGSGLCRFDDCDRCPFPLLIFPNLHLLGYVRLGHPFQVSSATYRFIAGSRGKNVAFNRPGAIPDNPRVGLARRDGCVFRIYDIVRMGSGFRRFPIRQGSVLFTCCIPLPLVQSPRPVPRNAQDVLIIRRTEGNPRYRQRVPIQRSPHRPIIVLHRIDTDDGVCRRCRFTSGSEQSFRR